MDRIALGKDIPQRYKEALFQELIRSGRTPIYVGDHVRVSKDYGFHKGAEGEVKGVLACSQTTFGLGVLANPDYLICRIRTDQGETIEEFYYTLEKTYQADRNMQ